MQSKKTNRIKKEVQDAKMRFEDAILSFEDRTTRSFVMDGDWVSAKPGHRMLMVRTSQSEKVTLIVSEMKTGVYFGMHHHDDSLERFFLARGMAEFTDHLGKKRTYHEGDSWYVEEGRDHAFLAVTDVLVIATFRPPLPSVA